MGKNGINRLGIWPCEQPIKGLTIANGSRGIDTRVVTPRGKYRRGMLSRRPRHCTVNKVAGADSEGEDETDWEAVPGHSAPAAWPTPDTSSGPSGGTTQDRTGNHRHRYWHSTTSENLQRSTGAPPPRGVMGCSQGIDRALCTSTAANISRLATIPSETVGTSFY
ncbi:hypothetical protein J6590_047413 [Homalodisca vitripennis]|nr:hypothetical protein J6590_047413 [Homalodisca vitripennis]